MTKVAKIGLALATGTGVIGVGAGIYLSQEKTIKDRLVGKGIDLAKEDEEYQVAFKELKSTAGFKEDIKNIGDSTTLQEGGTKLKKWCEDHLQKSLSEKDIENLLKKVKSYCGSRPLTIKERYTKNKKQLVSNWSTKLNSLKDSTGNNTDLQKDLVKLEAKITTLILPDADTVWKTLKKWCETNVGKKIIEDDKDAIWKKVERRCIEDIKA